jgi:hypothetical protein
MDSRTPRVIQQTRVIVGVLREQARSYNEQRYPYFETYFVPCGSSSFACNIPHSRRMIE